VILADDAVVVREGVARLLNEQRIEVAAQTGSANELQALVARVRPDVCVIDIRMPPTFTNEGLLAAQEIRRTHPSVGTLVLSQYVEVEYALRLLAERPERVGYLLKERIADVEDLADAIRRIAAGENVIDASLVSELIGSSSSPDRLADLTPRELEVLALMAQGRTDRGIAERLFLTRKTVESHVRSIFRKLDLPSDAGENRRVHAVLAFLGS
jgi:DNA-binding NarL/FixJ family response regulator